MDGTNDTPEGGMPPADTGQGSDQAPPPASDDQADQGDRRKESQGERGDVGDVGDEGDR